MSPRGGFALNSLGWASWADRITAHKWSLLADAAPPAGLDVVEKASLFIGGLAAQRAHASECEPAIAADATHSCAAHKTTPSGRWDLGAVSIGLDQIDRKIEAGDLGQIDPLIGVRL